MFIYNLIILYSMLKYIKLFNNFLFLILFLNSHRINNLFINLKFWFYVKTISIYLFNIIYVSGILLKKIE